MYARIDDRHAMMASGEAALRAHLPEDTPLKLTMVFADKHWQVRAAFLPVGHEPLLLGMENLEVFPSADMIATAMLVA